MGQTTDKMIRLRASCVLLFAFALTAEADEPTITYGKDYVSVLPGVSFPSKSLGSTGTGATVSGIYGYEFSRQFIGEVNIQSSTFETGATGGTDYYQNGVTFDLVYQLRDRAAGLFTPFVLVGAGVVYDDLYPNTRDGTAALLEAGIGIVSRPLFHEGIRFRLDGRYVRDEIEGGYSEPRVIFGIDIPLGRIEHRVEYLTAKTEVREVPVEHVVIKESPPEVLRDSDGDGVDDARDQCPDTPKGMRVDAQGCAVADQVFTLVGVHFEFKEARIARDAALILDRVSLAFIGQPSLRVEVAGHTDKAGSEKINLALSQRRAESVRDYLILRGARPDQLIARGYGKTQLLIDPERDGSDAESNRRVELRVLAR